MGYSAAAAVVAITGIRVSKNQTTKGTGSPDIMIFFGQNQDGNNTTATLLHPEIPHAHLKNKMLLTNIQYFFLLIVGQLISDADNLNQISPPKS